ncbi:hypothetical protein V8D89_014016 [Ganoderma adspersum]
MFPALGVYSSDRDGVLSHLLTSSTRYALLCFDAHQPCIRPRFVSFAILCFLVLAMFRLYRYCSRRSHVVQSARGVLQAMLTIITPTSSIWSPPYPSLAYRAAIQKTHLRTSLHIPLHTLYYDILHGLVELRNPRDHLPVLFKGSLSSVSELSVYLDVDFYWWMKLLVWMGSYNMFTDGRTYRIHWPQYTLKCLLVGSDAVAPTKTGHSTHSLDPPSLLFLNTLREETPTISLDLVPYRHLESHVLSLKSSLASGSFLMLGLTARAANANRSFWSKATVLTAVPFLPRRFLQPRVRRFGSLTQRTTTPLLASVLSVIQLLTSGPDPFTVEVVRNVSREYADFLHQTVDELENDPAIRAAFVREWGMQGWIEERLCIAWEAALVDAGMLENWVIVVCKAE